MSIELPTNVNPQPEMGSDPDMSDLQNDSTAQPTVSNPTLVTNASAPAVADPNANHPAVKHASVIRSIAETLAGGPRYKVSIDSQTGQRTATRVPLDKKDIGMAIAMSAITGALSGLQAKGPNATAQSGALGFNATAKARQQADQGNANQAQQDYENQASALARKSALMEHNLHMMQLTAALGHENEADLQKHVDAFGDVRDEQGTPAIADVSENDLRTKYAGKAGKLGQIASTYLALPSRVVPRLDADGNQVKNDDGIPQYELHWNLYDQTKQMPLSQDFINKAASYGVPGAIRSDGTAFKLPENATVSAPTYARMVRQMQAIDVFQRDLDDVANATKTKPVDAKSLVRSGQLSPTAITQYMRDHGAATNPAEAVNLMKSDPKANSYAPSIIAAFGPDAFTKYADAQKQKQAANAELGKESTPGGQAELNHKQLENKKLQSDLSAQAAQGQGLSVPKGFTPNPNAPQLSSADLQKDLQTKGVRLPANFETLYGIAHNSADLKTLPANPRKGSNQMSQQEGLSFIRQFINPQYQEGDYAAASGLSKELASTRQGTAGGSLLSAGVASNHLDLLEQASAALSNHDVQTLNKLANSIGVQLGDSPAVTFKAIAEQVNGEVGKVVAGGTPHEAELANLRANLNSDQSPQQVRNVIKSYIGLMAGRVNEINDRSQQYFGRDVKGISPAVSRVFNKYGFAVGSQVQVADPTGKVHIFQNQAAADQFKKAAGIQ